MRGVPVEVPARNQQERDIRGRIVGYQLGVGVMHEDLKKAWRRRGFFYDGDYMELLVIRSLHQNRIR